MPQSINGNKMGLGKPSCLALSRENQGNYDALYKLPNITNNNNKNGNLWGHMERTNTYKVSITYTIGTRAKKVPFIMMKNSDYQNRQ